jgi:hypothetical protein
MSLKSVKKRISKSFETDAQAFLSGSYIRVFDYLLPGRFPLLTSVLYFYIYIFHFYVHFSTLLHLLPLRFHCVEGCWDRFQNCDFGIDSRTL